MEELPELHEAEELASDDGVNVIKTENDEHQVRNI